MEKTVKFYPAYDKTSQGYDIHGVELSMVLKGKEGAIEFVVSTNWHLPHIQKRIIDSCLLKRDVYQLLPFPADVGYHSLSFKYEGQYNAETCILLDGRPCYYDGTTIGAKAVFNILLEKGSDGVWDELERLYKEYFDIK